MKKNKEFDFDDFILRLRTLAKSDDVNSTPRMGNLFSWFFSANKNDFLKAVYAYFLRRKIDSDAQIYGPVLDRTFGRFYVFGCVGASAESRIKNIHPQALYFICRCLRYSKRASDKFSILRRKLKLPKIQSKSKKKHESFYKYFEDEFRGNSDDIKNQLTQKYGKILEKATGVNALDLGCGRGEMLSLLTEKGFVPIGVDLNSIFINECKNKGLKSYNCDALQYLKKQPDKSIHVVSALHMIEHVDFEELMLIIEEIWRVLVPGGMVILETPNARNMHVSAGDFYRDPTHSTPVFPDTLDSIMRFNSFLGEHHFFDETNVPFKGAKINFDKIEDYYSVSRDYAWIGRKPGSN